MDEHAANAKAFSPLDAELAAIRAVTTRRQLASLFGRMAGAGTPRTINQITGPSTGREGPFSIAVIQDQKYPDRYVVAVGQSGLGLPGAEYYTDSTLADIKRSYETHVATMLGMAAWPHAAERAHDIVALETRIAAAHWTRAQMQDVNRTYNIMTAADLGTVAPDFDWRAFLAAADLPHVTRVVVDAPSAVTRIARLVADAPLAVWQARQAFAVIDDAAISSYLSDSAFAAAFDFHVRQFTNPSSVPTPRATRVAAVVTRNLGGLVSALYVARYSSASTRAAAAEMAANLKTAFDARLARLPWMSPATKTAARAKLAALTIAIGAPPTFETYDELEVRDDDLYGDAMRASAYDWRRRVRRVDEPYDRSAWTAMAPEYPNYNYEPATNTVEIPAAMLEPPFFDVRADPAVNYGALGAQIGQMIVSGFDNGGRHSDASGRLRDWWTASDAAAFETMTHALAAQYSTITPLPGLHLKGDLLVNEALDDLGGMLIALDAYHLSLKGTPAPVKDGFTGDQRFFLGRAQMWRAKFDPAFVRNQLATAHNAQPFVRVNGPIRHIDAWYDAFGVKPGDAMYVAPEQRVRIW